MLEVVRYQFRSRLHKPYALRNTFTGIILPKTYWSKSGARRAANRKARKLNKIINSL